MALSVVQQVSGSTGGTNASTLGVNFAATVANNLTVVGFVWVGGTLTSVQDNHGTSWTAGPTITDGTSILGLFYLANAPSLTSVTITLSTTTIILGVGYEVSGAATTSPEDKTGTSSASSTAASVTASGATAQANEIVLAFIVHIVAASSNATAGSFTSGYTVSTEVTGPTGGSLNTKVQMYGARDIISAISTPTFAGTWATTGTLVNALATFKAASGGGVLVPSKSLIIPSQAVIRASNW